MAIGKSNSTVDNKNENNSNSNQITNKNIEETKTNVK
jgi:hypothetical protein